MGERKTKMWFAYSNSAIQINPPVPLAIIAFRSQWRKYVVEFASKAVFDDECLQDIVDFQKAQTKLWREEVRNRHVGADILSGQNKGESND